MKDLSPAFDGMLCFSLYSAAHAVQHAYKPMLSELGISYPQYLVLVALWQKDGQTVGSVGTQLHLETNTLTPLLKRMQAADLLHRTRSKDDERQVLLHLTDKGRRMQDHAARLSASILCQSGLIERELLDLQQQINTVRDRFRASAGRSTAQ